jgi:hypothetical protein
MKKEVLFTIGYFVLLILCMQLIDQKYGDLPPRSWSVLFILSSILGRVSRKLSLWLVNTYLFFGVVILVLLLCFEGIYKLLFYLS